MFHHVLLPRKSTGTLHESGHALTLDLLLSSVEIIVDTIEFLACLVLFIRLLNGLLLPARVDVESHWSTVLSRVMIVVRIQRGHDIGVHLFMH